MTSSEGTRTLYNSKASDAKWECRDECVKTTRYQTSVIWNTLHQVSETSDHTKVKSEAEALVNYEIQHFEFLLEMAVWYINYTVRREY
jgi:hypothetical protein